MSTASLAATLEDLALVEGKAELVGGRIIRYMPTGDVPSEIAFEIAVSLRAHAKRTGVGIAYGDGVGYAIRPPLPSGRQSFCPDASYHVGPRSSNPMRFLDGAPIFAVEVRSEGDYGPAAEAEMAAKRGDYFAAGTRVVWDVDPMTGTIAVYRYNNPDRPVVFSGDDIADAKPAVVGWHLTVKAIMS